MPVYVAKAGGFFFIVFGVLAMISALVQINPVEREGTPRSAREIASRLNEVSFNAVLLNRISDTAPVTLLGGSLLLQGLVNTYYSERIGAVTLAEGDSDLQITGSGSAFWRADLLAQLRARRGGGAAASGPASGGSRFKVEEIK